MSGGFFDYYQYHIDTIADSIEGVLDNQGKEKPSDEWDGGYLKEYPVKLYPTYPEVVQDKMREAVKQLRIARVYAQRIDYFLSGDDGEETFVKRLEKELKDIENEKSII
jgi:hypothetical protein